MQIAVQDIMDHLGLLISICVGIYAFFANRRKDVDLRFDAIGKRIDRHDTRMVKLEEEVRNLPAKEDFHSLQILLTEMGGEMKAMAATMDGMSSSLKRTESIVTRHEDHLRGSS